MWTGCVAGALVKSEYQRLLEEAGFKDVSFEITRRYERQDLEEMLGNLVDNACKWGRARVTLRAEAVTATGAATSGLFRLKMHASTT